VVFALTAWRATHADAMPNENISTAEQEALRLGSYRSSLVSELDRAIDRDPFHPERRRPQVRYALERPGPVNPPAGAPVTEPVELIGTVVAAGGRSFAMCRTSAGPQIVRIGGKVGGFTLKSVEQGSAVFVSPAGKPMTVLVKKTGS
jgi:hypothetical protein